MTFNLPAERDKFIENNLPLVVNRIRKLNRGVFDEELFQVGSLALVEATNRFDKDRNTEFSTYATGYIDNYLLKHRIFDSPIKPKRKNRRWEFEYKQITSLDVETDDGVSFGDTIHSDYSIEDNVIEGLMVNEFLNSLSVRNRKIIDLLLDGFNHEEISKIIGTHRTYVCKLISKEGKRYVARYLS